MRRVCPKCDVPLFILHFKDIELDFCHQCRGLWLDAGELEALLQRTGGNANDPLLQFQQQMGTETKGRPHLCPRCDAALSEIQVKRAAPADATATGGTPVQLTLDKCPRGHGLWFDADELQQLLSMFPVESSAARTVDHLNELFGMKSKL
jgi:Zn-finger nucleic acid-binding protein